MEVAGDERRELAVAGVAEEELRPAFERAQVGDRRVGDRRVVPRVAAVVGADPGPVVGADLGVEPEGVVDLARAREAAPGREDHEVTLGPERPHGAHRPVGQAGVAVEERAVEVEDEGVEEVAGDERRHGGVWIPCAGRYPGSSYDIMPNPTETRAPRPRPRLPWALLPLALALAYAGTSGPRRKARPRSRRWSPPTRSSSGAGRTSRRSTRSGADPDAGRNVAAPSVALGAELNVPGLPGVDRTRPLVEAILPPGGRSDPRLIVLPVADGAALEAKFRDPELPERHARHLEVHGAWAASCSDRLVVRDAGTYASPLPPPKAKTGA